MDVREAVAAAKAHVGQLYADDPIDQLRLEEFLFDDHLGVWTVTIGFTSARSPSPQDRRYKIVRIAQSDRAILSVKDREPGR